jgi:predicted acyltransferase
MMEPTSRDADGRGIFHMTDATPPANSPAPAEKPAAAAPAAAAGSPAPGISESTAPLPAAGVMGPAKPARLVSLDAYRGLIMITLISAGFGFKEMAKKHADSPLWSYLGSHAEHTFWKSASYINFLGLSLPLGVTYWDLIAPAFMFMVGVSMPYSYSRRLAEGESRLKLWGHVLSRSLILILLGVLLSSHKTERTNWVFFNVLSQIGLGYWAVYLFLGKRVRWQVAGILFILFAHWLAFVLYPVSNHPGLFGHWTRHHNLGAAFDQWFLNLFPRPDRKPYVNFGGYVTLNFIPSIVTMVFGLMCGELLRTKKDGWQKVRLMFLAGLMLILLGALMGETVCPIIKRLWTPSWTLFSGGYALWGLATLYMICDVMGWKKWTFPLTVVGMNSMLMYMGSELHWSTISGGISKHLATKAFWGYYGPVLNSLLVLGVFWVIAYWFYKQKAFLRI